MHSSNAPCSLLTRRDLIKRSAAALVCGPLLRSNAADNMAPSTTARREIVDYLRRHARADGGYAFAGQEASHLSATFAAIGSLRLLDSLPPDLGKVADFVRTHHPRELRRKEHERRSFEYQQVQTLLWLGDPADDLRPLIRTLTTPRKYNPYFEQHGYPVFQFEVGVVQCHALLGLPLAGLAKAFLDYIGPRRRANGSFNNTPAVEGGDGHVMNTWWGLQALRALGQTEEKGRETVAWLQACQRPDGGFTWQPEPLFSGEPDVAYTRAALRALRLLGAAPRDPGACRTWLLSLAQADGGFGDRPGWASNLLATYCTLDALEALDASSAVVAIRRPAPLARTSLPSGLKLYSMQVEAHGSGSPADAVALAGALKIDLWGAKNAKPAWLERARAVAAAQDVPVQFFAANEEQGTWLHVPGLGTYSHTSDVMAPPHGDVGLSLANQGPVTWPEYRSRRLHPLHRGQGRLIWQFGENEELARLLLDDSCARGGFSAISTFHYSNPDFTNTEPFLHRWRGRIPFISLQDAHGPEPWWFADFTTGHRTLFLGTEPSWEAWLKALDRNWVAAVRHDAMSRQQTWIHSGSDEVLERVRQREKDWRWWSEGGVQRPMVSLVAVTPADEFEAGRPERGVALRVRCAWTNTEGGQPESPLAELVHLTLDGQTVKPAVVQKPRASGTGLLDHYHVWLAPDIRAGRHVAVAVVRELSGSREHHQRLEFETAL